jgi:uncharacterized membrane protein (UPF0127 family)
MLDHISKKKIITSVTIVLVIIFVLAWWYVYRNFYQWGNRNNTPLYDNSGIRSLSVSTTIPKTLKKQVSKFKVLLADTPELQEKGLGDRASLDPQSAMLFTFNNVEPAEHFFWMKDMLFPIDIVWLNQDKQVIYIQEDVPPNSYPSSFGPNANSTYVLEFDAGTVDTINLNTGDVFTF